MFCSLYPSLFSPGKIDIIQKYQSGKHLEPIEKTKAKQRQATSGKGVYGGKPLKENLPEAVEGRTRDKVATYSIELSLHVYIVKQMA